MKQRDNVTDFLLIRHGETAWHLPTEKGAKGWGADMAPLTETGINQIKSIIPLVRDWSPEYFLTSPTSRTLNTCALLSAALKVPFKVEFDLHEWIPDYRLKWESVKEVTTAQREMESLGGEWPEGETRYWEPLSKVRQRSLSVLEKHLTKTKVAVVYHEWVINALTDQKIQLAESVEFTIKA